MKANWIIKYYFVAFLGIFSFVYHIENSEPFVNWSLYPEVSMSTVNSYIKTNDCDGLEKIFINELNTNYKVNSLGFFIRNDGRSIRGLNLIKYLKYHIDNMGC